MSMSPYNGAARRESFDLVSETCPDVDTALQEASEKIKGRNGALREALIGALERALGAEERVLDLERELEEANARIRDLS